jgi:hypothetical protein
MKFNDLVFEKHKNAPDFSIQAKVKFDNGYGASVIRGPHSYGGPEGLYELAVLKGDDLCYDTPITDDVLGYQSEDDISNLLERIEALPKA